jgi:hydrogenase expression/formation protein HypE
MSTALDSHISLAHGNGGRFMRELIEAIFARAFADAALDTEADAVTLPWNAPHLTMTTDGFTVQPLEFAGCGIGALAAHGVINDLAVSGARPRYLSLSAIIEEGLETAVLQRAAENFAHAAAEAGARVVCGDTKVVPRGSGGGLYLAVTGVGERDARAERLSIRAVRPGDVLLVSGPVGDHGTAVMLAREQFGLRGDVRSDSASVLPLCQALLAVPGLRFMRDPTRGGLATVAHEIARAAGCTLHLEQAALPVRPAVQSVCDMLGYDPLYLACEGRVVAVVAPEQAPAAIAALRGHADGAQAAIIGAAAAGPARVVLHTPLGGERVLEELEDDPLPRIC